MSIEEPRFLPTDVMDYLVKTSAYFFGYIPKGRKKEIEKRFKDMSDKLLEKYDIIEGKE